MKKNTSVFRRALDGLAPVAPVFASLLLSSTAVAVPAITTVLLENEAVQLAESKRCYACTFFRFGLIYRMQE